MILLNVSYKLRKLVFTFDSSLNTDDDADIWAVTEFCMSARLYTSLEG
jgi:hypothetical protein